MRNLLSDPTPTPAEGGDGTAQADPKSTEPTPAEPRPAVSPDLVAELQAMKAELLAFRSERTAREEEARKAAAAELAKKGQLEEIARNHEAALKARDAAYQALEAKARAAELRRAITAALSGHNLVEGASDQLLRLWVDDFEVEDAADGFKVRCKSDLREPSVVVAERLGSKGYAHFVRAAGRGGGGAGGGVPAPTGGASATGAGGSGQFLSDQLLSERQRRFESGDVARWMR